MEQLWWIAHALVVPAWLALLIRPGPAMTRIARLVAGALAAGYLVLFLLHAREASVLARDYSPDGVTLFFADPALRLVGWVHYLAFDLVVGAWEADEARRLGLSRALLIVSLFATFLVGPVGFLLFLVLSWNRSRAAPAS